MTFVGRPIRRVEDARLVRGRGRYIADLRPPGALEAVIVRSPHAHARILSIDVSEAWSVPGVETVLTAADLPTNLMPIPLRLGARIEHSYGRQYPLAAQRVRYVGEPVAVVVAKDRYVAEDAAERVRIVYEPLPPVTSVQAGLEPGAPVLHPELGHNVAASFWQETGDVGAALATAEVVIEASFAVGRNTAMPLETRGLVAEYDGEHRRLRVWGPTKVVHFNRSILAQMLGWPEERIHFVEPDVGGGFGARGEFYPEDFLIPYLALQLRRPVVWVEDRREHMLAINHSREQVYEVRAGVTKDGIITALDVRILCDNGAYLRTHGVVVADLGSALLPGPYRIPNYRAQVQVVFTNKTPMGTYRGPGRYEGTFVRERMIDLIAQRLGLDPAEIRRRNFIRPDEMPYRVGTTGLDIETIYDSGNCPDLLERALAAIDYEGVRRLQRNTRAGKSRNGGQNNGGRRIGVGLAAFVEKSGTGPWEYARLEVDRNGGVRLFTGAANLGQGITTALRQIVADQLGVEPSNIDVVHGDTDVVPKGMGSWASRSVVMAGNAAHEVAKLVRQRGLEVAAQQLEVSPDDLEVIRGGIQLRGVPSRFLCWSEVADRASEDGKLVAEHVFTVEHMTYPFGVHAAVVAVDVETGLVQVLRYAIAYDAGRVINPMIVTGQLVGGLAQGIGGALLEQLVYDEQGQMLSGTFMDYLMPTSMEVPTDIKLCVSEETPSPLNPLGVKGAGEGGCTGAGAAVANAVADALGGVFIDRIPLTIERVWQWAAHLRN